MGCRDSLGLPSPTDIFKSSPRPYLPYCRHPPCTALPDLHEPGSPCCPPQTLSLSSGGLSPWKFPLLLFFTGCLCSGSLPTSVAVQLCAPTPGIYFPRLLSSSIPIHQSSCVLLRQPIPGQQPRAELLELTSWSDPSLQPNAPASS